MPSPIDDPRSQLGEKVIAAPLSAAAAAEHPVFDAFASERAKLDSGGPTAVNWSEVLRTGSIILNELGKDLSVATFYGFALFWRERLFGLAISLIIIDDILQQHWETATPPVKRLRARANTVQWLGDRLVAHYKAAEETSAAGSTPDNDTARALQKAESPSAANSEILSICKTRLRSIDDRFRGLDYEPNLIDFRKLIERFDREASELATKAAAELAAKAVKLESQATSQPPIRETPASEAPPAAQPSPPPPPPPAPTTTSPTLPSSPGISAGMSVEQVETALTQTSSNIRQAAKILLAHKLTDPRPYQMIRFSIWAGLFAPPLSQQGKTLLMSPPTDRIRYLSSLVNDNNFQTAISEIESSIGNAPFWLDGHRLTATCLQALGPDYAPARIIVVDALATLLRRFPTLIDLKFQTGMPFADTMTQAWLKNEVLSGGEGGGPIDAWSAGLDEARGLAAKGQIDAAARILAGGRRQADGLRARVHWDLVQARFAFEIKQVPVAIRLLEDLDDRIVAQNLEDWEPGTAVLMTRLLLDCYAHGAQPTKPPPPGTPPVPIVAVQVPAEHKVRLERLHARLARLDLAAALASGSA